MPGIQLLHYTRENLDDRNKKCAYGKVAVKHEILQLCYYNMYIVIFSHTILAKDYKLKLTILITLFD